MSDYRSKLVMTVSAELTKRGDVLEGVIRISDKPKDAKPKRLPRKEWDDALAEHFETMAEGDTVKAEVTVDNGNNGARRARLAGVAPLPRIEQDADRQKLVEANGGFVNPYTFVPTLPRSDQHGSRLTGTGLEDGAPASHGLHVDGQWSGVLALTLTTVTPLLSPVPVVPQPKDGIRTFDVRVGPDGRPLIHGASLKGALRSAYETVTASRYGVFFEHDERLAYRAQAENALSLTPARVYRETPDGPGVFRLYPDDATVLVPAYGKTPVTRLGALADGLLSAHHGKKVYARVVRTRQGRRATHLAYSEQEILDHLRGRGFGHSDVDGQPAIVLGWLSATGRNIKSKSYERLFTEGTGEDIPITIEHERYWRSVLRAYDLAQGYNDPSATYRRDPATADAIERSWHVPSDEHLRALPEGTLVYVEYDRARKQITEVHPVMVGRRPFDAAPSELLHDSLRPARKREELSPADRLFGWVPPGRPDDGAETNDGSSGYRGRLRIRSIRCSTKDWRPASFPPEGVTLAPLSSPKPTQFRFYASRDQNGMPMTRGTEKAEGYQENGGLRGRKMYRWREESPEYWQLSPTTRFRSKDDPREYLALEEHHEHSKQLVRHRGWVRPDVTFHAELFLDGVSEAELSALIWLLTRGKDAPLRLGAGKPYGFGVVTAQLDPERTRLWDAAGVRAGWLRLTRPDPVSTDRLTQLADQFDATATGNEVLREATESHLAAAKPVADPVHYPRESEKPQAESFRWFVANEKADHRWSLPHVRSDEQRLPYLGKDGDQDQRAGGGKKKAHSAGKSSNLPTQRQNSGSRKGGRQSGIQPGSSGKRGRPRR